MFQSCIVRWLTKIRKWPHAGAVGPQSHHTPTRQKVHALWTGIGETGNLTVQGVGNKPASLRKRPVIFICVITPKQHDIAKSHSPILFLKSLNVVRIDEGTDSLGSLVKQVTDIDDTGFTTEASILSLNARPKRPDFSRFRSGLATE